MPSAGFYRDLASRLRALLQETPRHELAKALSEIARDVEGAAADLEGGRSILAHLES